MTNYIYLISQNKFTGYDTYDSAVVCAPNEIIARRIKPCGLIAENDEPQQKRHPEWCSPLDVKVERIGTADENQEVGLILASFNAG